jgi:tripartite-type tricarboxylate transporter receptor subunit TctC
VRFPLILVSGAQKGLNTTEDLIALARQKPGQVTYGSGGPGSAHHLAMAIFAKKAGLDTTRKRLKIF